MLQKQEWAEYYLLCSASSRYSFCSLNETTEVSERSDNRTILVPQFHLFFFSLSFSLSFMTRKREKRRHQRERERERDMERDFMDYREWSQNKILFWVKEQFLIEDATERDKGYRTTSHTWVTCRGFQSEKFERGKEIEISSSVNVRQTKEDAGKEESNFQFRGIFFRNSIHSAGKWKRFRISTSSLTLESTLDSVKKETSHTDP